MNVPPPLEWRDKVGHKSMANTYSFALLGPDHGDTDVEFTDRGRPRKRWGTRRLSGGRRQRQPSARPGCAD